MVWPTGCGREWAETLLCWRQKIYPYPVKVKERRDLYEIKYSKAVCIYEELVFHDNRADAAWLHDHLPLLAEYTARAFCEIFEIPFHAPGDVDGDGEVTSTDARLALQAAVGKGELSAGQQAAADVDGDGKVTSTDARLILQHSIGKD
ncbi:MAG: dockerin type I repeat-containing protein [Clostridia bacterium]|nr:dockerin type I repeat-containing protein [Clostridia bacterium]